MAYLVKVTSRAERDLAALYEQIHASDSERSRQWYLGLTESILGLREMPNRHSVTPENRGLRSLLYGHKPHIFRVIFRVLTKAREVEVLHVRHGARRRFRASDLK